ncbi:phospholipase A and acyltransferase 3-like [Oncorhynchus nerka]|uniref:phospholipase A and acyltransferase 3-like n=1 Tax=Oncorhynchus nerka TaxID=8023 RepID=UPI0011309A73|nr:phospholipase A and acyltransferase 3-like [Oncorhynchus nerka]XP_029518381.1 phospholipase A and acyltransferase 3-like [Oncorhynchus nerka]
MAPTLYDKKPEPGDLIEIFRGNYQHWALYVGDGFVVHLAPPSEGPGAGANSMMSVLSDKAKVKKEEIWDVVGHDQWCVNNQLDEKYQVRPIHEILREAQAYVDQEMPYCVFRGNCEHFVTELRYGKAESRQVRQAVGIGATLVGFGILAFVGIAAIFGGGSKKKNEEEEEYK